MIYLDNAASPIINDKLIKIIKKNIEEMNKISNPHSNNILGNNMSNIINDVRNKILNMYNTNKDEYYCIFTHNATHSIKLIGEYFDWDSESKFIYTKSNHNSLLGIRNYAPNVMVIDNSFNMINYWENKIITLNNKKNKTLIGLSLECNFSGKINYYEDIINDNNYIILLDASKYCSTNLLDLQKIKPDFITLSIYKLLGYPTGLGVLLIKNTSFKYLKKNYYGGGTLNLSMSNIDKQIPHSDIIKSFEDGTLPYQQIYYTRDILNRWLYLYNKNKDNLKKLIKYTYDELKKLEYENGNKLIEIYGIDDETIKDHGSIISFNLRDRENNYISYLEFEKIANLNKICIRTGCFCNPGACQEYLKLTDQEILNNNTIGHTCWNQMDIINEKITGAIRVSLHFKTKKKEIDNFIKFIKKNYLNEINNNIDIINDNKKLSIDKIIIYPIKSCTGIELTKWIITDNGFLYDRIFGIYDDKYNLLTLKKNPTLNNIIPSIDINKNIMIIKFNKDKIILDLNKDIDNTVNIWLSDKLKMNVKLLKNDNHLYQTDQFLIISNSSLLDLNYKIYIQNYLFSLLPYYIQYNICKYYPIITYHRFRPNIILNGINSYDEDKINQIILNNIILNFNKSCSRCYTTVVNNNTSKLDNNLEPIRTLKKYRNTKNGILFGRLFNIYNYIKNEYIELDNIKIELNY